jgi:hypothetical protein
MRLQRIKAQHDPDNLFRVNRNIPPPRLQQSQNDGIAA